MLWHGQGHRAGPFSPLAPCTAGNMRVTSGRCLDPAEPLALKPDGPPWGHPKQHHHLWGSTWGMGPESTAAKEGSKGISVPGKQPRAQCCPVPNGQDKAGEQQHPSKCCH